MSLNTSDESEDKVAVLLKGLDEDASKLRQEAKSLQEMRDQWTPVTVDGRTALTPGGKQLPSRCLNKLEQAAAYDEQVHHCRRRESTGEREAKRAAEQRQDVEQAADAAVQEAERRRLDAERRLLELREMRREAEIERIACSSAEELSTEAELSVIQRRVEQLRRATAAESSQARQDTLAQRSRVEREIADLKAEFERRAEAYERGLQEYDAACDAGVAEAQERACAADEAATKIWEESDALVQSSQVEIDQQLQEQQSREEEAHAEETNKQLAEEEAQEAALAKEISEILLRMKAANEDHAVEEKATALRVEVAEFIRNRRAERDRRVQESLNSIASLTVEATKTAAAANARAQAEQAKTDRQVEAVLAEMEKFGNSELSDPITKVHANLEVAVKAAKDEFQQRLQAFQEQIDQQKREADRALINADRKVEEIRINAGTVMEQNSQAMERSIKGIRSERERVVAECSGKVQSTQEQMVRFVGSHFEDMLDSLNKAEPAEVPLRLDLCAAILG